MFYDNFKIGGTSEAPLDFNDRARVPPKWEEVLLSMTSVPDEDIFGHFEQKSAPSPRN